MLKDVPVFATLAVADVDRARRWYEEKLGLTPAMEMPGGNGMVYRAGGSIFLLYLTDNAGTAANTVATILVEDLAAVMTDLRGRGVVFEDYAMGNRGPTTVDGIAEDSDGSKGAWFKDSEGNVLGLAQLPTGMSLPS